MHVFLGLCVPEYGEEFHMTNYETSRMVCHLVIQNLPDSAMGDAVESLKGMYEFYRDPPLAIPVTARNPPVKATVSRSYTAPVYPITEE